MLAIGHCHILPNKDKIKGDLHLFQMDNNVTVIKTDVKGLSPGLHGIHVHQSPVEDEDCNSTGPHFNPFQTTHGDVGCHEKHAGDLGNL